MNHGKLEPPDPKRCQADKITYNAWGIGGSPYKRLRCTNRAHWLVQELEPGPDGIRGHMTMCDECAEVFIDKRLYPPKHYSMEWIGK